MPEEKRAPKQDSREPDYTPASPVKRTLAWIGLVYMVILLALTTYGLFTEPVWATWGHCSPSPASSAWGFSPWSPGGPPAVRGNGPPSPWPPCAGCWPWPPCPSESPG